MSAAGRWEHAGPALGGAALASLAHALLFPGLPGWSWLAAKLCLILPGNLLLAGLLAGAAGRLLGPALSGRRAFWLGLAVGLGGMLGSWLAGPRDLTGRGRFFVPAATVLLLALLLLAAGRLPLPALRPRLGLVLAGALLLLACGAAFLDLQPGTRAVRFQPQERLPLPPPPGEEVPDGPAVLLVVVDTLRADVLAEVPTPHLDALREEALNGAFAVVSYPGTLPSHVSMFTGTGILTHGARDNRDKMRPELPALAQIFRAHGWRTLGLAANSVLDPATGIARGFEVFENLAIRQELPLRAAKRLHWGVPNGTWTGLLVPEPLDRGMVLAVARQAIGDPQELGIAGGGLVRDTALAYLDELDSQNRPWFFFLHFMDPHLPYRPDPAVAGRLTAGRSLPAVYRDDGEPGGLLVAHHVKQDLAAGRPEAREATALLHDLYREEVMFVDACVGAVLERAQRCRRPVVVLFTADHGEFFGEHGELLHGYTVYEPVLRVPFLLTGPGVPAGELPVVPRLEDVAPTLLSLAGLPVPPAMEGRVLTGELSQGGGWASADREHLAWYEGDWKLVLAYDDLGTDEARLEPLALYDLSRDPGEERDLQAAEPERMARMLAAARRAVLQASARATRELGAGERTRLAALGYGGS